MRKRTDADLCMHRIGEKQRNEVFWRKAWRTFRHAGAGCGKTGRKSRRRAGTIALAAACLAMSVSLFVPPIFAEAAALPAGTQRAVTYFGDAWPINFWSSSFEQLDADFQQIKDDGFDAIVVCIPWNEFQPSMQSASFNESALSRLHELMEAAQRAALQVVLRLGYTWDYYGNAKNLERYKALTETKEAREAWLSYAARIYKEASAYPYFAGAFLTWEDFWNYLTEAQRIAGTFFGQQAAESSGYKAYVMTRYSREELIELYGSARDADALGYPKKNTQAYRLFLEWYDAWLMQLLKDTQAVFPGLAFESRLDSDAYPADKTGKTAYYGHNATFAGADAPYAAGMLSVGMGYAAGTELTVEQAANGARRQIARLAETGKPVWIDQFLYMETTPGYEEAPKLAETDMNAYLSEMGNVFAEQTVGYAIWTYRDYADNVLYNPDFALKTEGWQTSGPAFAAQTEENGAFVTLKKGGAVTQQLNDRSYLADSGMIVEFDVRTDEPVRIRVHTDAGMQTANVPAGGKRVQLRFDKQAKEEIRLTLVQGLTADIDNVCVYSHVTSGGVYDRSGKSGPYLDGVREMNRRFAEAYAALHPADAQ